MSYYLFLQLELKKQQSELEREEVMVAGLRRIGIDEIVLAKYESGVSGKRSTVAALSAALEATKGAKR